jgi:hypothetical protein
LELVGIGSKAGCRDSDQQRCADHPQQADANQHQEQHAGNAIHELFGLRVAAPVAILRQERDKGLRERAFGE